MASFLYLVAGLAIGTIGGWLVWGRRSGATATSEAAPAVAVPATVAPAAVATPAVAESTVSTADDDAAALPATFADDPAEPASASAGTEPASNFGEEVYVRSFP